MPAKKHSTAPANAQPGAEAPAFSGHSPTVDRRQLSEDICDQSLTVLESFKAIETIANRLDMPDCTVDDMSVRVLLLALAKAGLVAMLELGEIVYSEEHQSEVSRG